MKESSVGPNPSKDIDANAIKSKYFEDLLRFKRHEWQPRLERYDRKSLIHVTDYTLLKDGSYPTNVRTEAHTFGDTGFMEKLLRNAFKVNGFWISSYFMNRHFN